MLQSGTSVSVMQCDTQRKITVQCERLIQKTENFNFVCGRDTYG